MVTAPCKTHRVSLVPYRAVLQIYRYRAVPYHTRAIVATQILCNVKGMLLRDMRPLGRRVVFLRVLVGHICICFVQCFFLHLQTSCPHEALLGLCFLGRVFPTFFAVLSYLPRIFQFQLSFCVFFLCCWTGSEIKDGVACAFPTYSLEQGAVSVICISRVRLVVQSFWGVGFIVLLHNFKLNTNIGTYMLR